MQSGVARAMTGLRPTRQSARGRCCCAGFTLVEILIVVIILGILAAIVIPKFSDATDQARDSQLRKDLRTVRTQLELYKVQHGNNYPANADGDDADTFGAQLTRKTNEQGEYGASADPAPTLGPYLRTMPRNPFAIDAANQVELGDTQNADGRPGWFYDPATGTFKPNDAGHADL